MDLRPGHRPAVGVISLQGTGTETGERVAILAMETPVPLTESGARLDKNRVERLHLERYRADSFTATGELPFDAVSQGSDPPDFLVETDNGPEGIDCTVLALEERRSAYRLFALLRSRLLAAAKGEGFPNLRDTVMYVWFGLADGLPPKRQDTRTVDALLKCMREAHVDRERMQEVAAQIAREGFPKQFPEGGSAIFSTPDQEAGFTVVPSTAESLFGPFVQEAGFACELSMSTEVRESQVRTELERLIRKHDTVGNNRLLITIGGPDRDGLRYPAEEQMMAFVTAEMIQSTPVKHLTRISLHTFASGALAEVRLHPHV